jgi:hypothetical protein
MISVMERTVVAPVILAYVKNAIRICFENKNIYRRRMQMKLVNFRITFLGFFLVTLITLNFSIVSISQSAKIQSKELIKLQTRSKVTQKFILIKPNNPTASVVLFEGGSGILKLGSAFGKPTINQKNTSGIISHRAEFANLRGCNNFSLLINGAMRFVSQLGAASHPNNRGIWICR